jgi:hypothetical protein
MRYYEILQEVTTSDDPEKWRLWQIMYGQGPMPSEIEMEELEAARLENAMMRAKITQIIDTMSDPLTDDLRKAQIVKTKADAAAKLVGR